MTATNPSSDHGEEGKKQRVFAWACCQTKRGGKVSADTMRLRRKVRSAALSRPRFSAKKMRAYMQGLQNYNPEDMENMMSMKSK
jgi:hypothetical protein